MKTTIDIPDALAAQAKEVARVRQSTLRELVISGLRAEIERQGHSESFVFHFPTTCGEGLTPGVGPGDAITRSYDLPT